MKLSALFLLCTICAFAQDVHIVPRGPIKSEPATTAAAPSLARPGDPPPALGLKPEPPLPAALLFRGFSPGMKVREFRDHHVARDGVAPNCTRSNNTVECFGLHPSQLVAAQFVDEQLAMAFWRIRRVDFFEMRDALIHKYGDPQSHDTRSYVSAMGAHLTGDVLVWRSGSTVLELQERGSHIDEGWVTIRDDDLMKEYRKAKPNKADI